MVYNLPLLTLSSHPVHLLLYEEDSLGGEFVPNHLIVEFTDEATQFEKDTLLEYYQAERLDTCLCGIIELWELPDTSVLPGGEILVGVEESKQDARAKSEIEDAGNNYLMELLIEKAKIKPFFKPKLPKEPLPDNIIIRNETVPTVAIIDVGIDYNHPSLTPYIWSNAAEIVDGEDNDGNCLIDDARGYNFNKDNNDALDMTNGHGTHVAGIVVENIPVGDVELINIKSHGDDGVGLLFEALCGIYYAAEKEANVINLSWGYRGVASSVLESAIARAGADCGSLVVTSAGNEGLNTDELPHYPSSYELENLIAVAALNETEDALSPESNYGPASVHLAAPGTRIFSTVPGGGFDFKSGTSMAAAAVSNVAAQLCAANPEATYANIKTAILNTVLELVSLEDLSTGGKLNTEAALEFIAFVEADTSCFLVDLLPEVSYSNLKAKAYPQPFHDKVFLELPLEKSSLFQISIFNLVGELVFSGTELLGPDQSGFSWDGRRANSIALPPGIYIAQLQTNHIRFITQLVKI